MEETKELYSSGTEKSILGCMFLDRAAAEMGRNTLKAEDFYIPMYRAIFEAMQAVELYGTSCSEREKASASALIC